MHSPRVCKYCKTNTMEFITYAGFAFCDTDCLVEWVLENKEVRSTKRAPDRLVVWIAVVSLVVNMVLLTLVMLPIGCR